MEIARGRTEEASPDSGQHGIAQVPVHPRHGAWPNAAKKAVAHHEIRPFAHLVDEGVKPREVIAVVGVGHDDELPACRGNPALERFAVTSLLDVHDGRVAVAASDTRVGVVWTTARQLTANDPTGAYAVFACR